TAVGQARSTAADAVERVLVGGVGRDAVRIRPADGVGLEVRVATVVAVDRDRVDVAGVVDDPVPQLRALSAGLPEAVARRPHTTGDLDAVRRDDVDRPVVADVRSGTGQADLPDPVLGGRPELTRAVVDRAVGLGDRTDQAR